MSDLLSIYQAIPIEWKTILFFGLLFFFIMMGVPLTFVLGGLSIIFLYFHKGPIFFYLIASKMWDLMETSALIAIFSDFTYAFSVLTILPEATYISMPTTATTSGTNTSNTSRTLPRSMRRASGVRGGTDADFGCSDSGDVSVMRRLAMGAGRTPAGRGGDERR